MGCEFHSAALQLCQRTCLHLGTLVLLKPRGGGRAHAQESASRRRLQDHPASGQHDLRARGREADRRRRRRGGVPGSAKGASRSHPRRRDHAAAGGVRAVPEAPCRRGVEGCAGASSRRRRTDRSGQGDGGGRQRAHAQAVRFGEADRAGEADPRQSEGGEAGGFRSPACRTARRARARPALGTSSDVQAAGCTWRRGKHDGDGSSASGARRSEASPDAASCRTAPCRQAAVDPAGSRCETPGSGCKTAALVTGTQARPARVPASDGSACSAAVRSTTGAHQASGPACEASAAQAAGSDRG